MRKILIMLPALVLFHSGCEPDEELGIVQVSNNELQQFHYEFQEMFKGAFQQLENLNMATILDQSDEHLKVRIERETITEAANSILKDHFVEYHSIDKLSEFPGPALLFSTDYASAARRFEKIIDTASIFNKAQKSFVHSLSETLESAKNPKEGIELLVSFKEQVMNSYNLSDDEKLILIELASGSLALLEFLSNDMQASQMYLKDILGINTPIGRTYGCSVDWRNVWMDGVVGLVSGATWGGYIGATAGTFTVPVLGTATGAVGGAVLGGASGFISGVSYGVVSNLLTSCFRQHEKLNPTFATCDLAWQAYMNNEISKLPSECFEISIKVKGLS